MQFDQFAGNYQEVLDQAVAASGEGSSYFAEYKANYLSRVLASGTFTRVLDYGCGVGLLSRFLLHHLRPSRLDGFDVSEDSIRKVDVTLSESGTFTSNPVDLGDDYTLIVVANVLHHVEPAQRETLCQRLASRLSPGGVLAVFEHNPINPVTRRTVERCPFDEDAILLPRSEALQHLRSAQLRIRRADYIVFLPHALAALRFLEPMLVWLPMGAQYAVIGEKRG